jgi:two-component system, cell cycle sensor histidine kinase and response regulator CckA
MDRGTETILVIDDEEMVRSLTVRVLKMCGYTVLEAGDGASARQAEAGHNGPIHLALCDLLLPDVGGRELAGQLLAARPDLKVLFTSGQPDDTPPAPGTGFLAKPFSPAALAKRVRELLDAAA